MGWKLPLCRWPFPRLCGFSSVHWAGEVIQRPILSSSFRLRLGHYPANPSRPGRSRPAPPWSFLALQHIKPRGSTGRGFYLPATFRPQGLVTLSTVCSPRGPAGSIYAGGALGLHPSELVLAPGTCTLLCRRTHLPFCSISKTTTAAVARLQWTAVPGLHPSGEFLPCQQAVDPLVTRKLPWVFPF